MCLCTGITWGASEIPTPCSILRLGFNWCGVWPRFGTFESSTGSSNVQASLGTTELEIWSHVFPTSDLWRVWSLGFCIKVKSRGWSPSAWIYQVAINMGRNLIYIKPEQLVNKLKQLCIYSHTHTHTNYQCWTQQHFKVIFSDWVCLQFELPDKTQGSQLNLNFR